MTAHDFAVEGLWAVIEGVNELREREFPSLAKEGCREAAGWFDQEINYLTNTTPALRATPPLLRRGISLVCQFIHTFIDRPYKGTTGTFTNER
jgi:hypothetical protein